LIATGAADKTIRV
jgi:THO complex subunit 3